MLRIRLQRVGRKHEPSFRIVLTESQNSTKTGRVLEVLGNHDPRFHNPTIKADRVKHWISVGAKPTDTMHNLLVTQKIIEGKKKNVLPRKSPIVKEPSAEEKAKAAEAAAPKAEVSIEEKSEEVAATEEKAALEAKTEEAVAPVEEEKVESVEAIPEETSEETVAEEAKEEKVATQ